MNTMGQNSMRFAPALLYLCYHEARLILSVPVPVHVAQLLTGRYESRRQWCPKKEYFTNIKDSTHTQIRIRMFWASGTRIRMIRASGTRIRNYLYGYGSGPSMNSKQI
jgi:hypothetical protein